MGYLIHKGVDREPSLAGMSYWSIISLAAVVASSFVLILVLTLFGVDVVVAVGIVLFLSIATYLSLKFYNKRFTEGGVLDKLAYKRLPKGYQSALLGVVLYHRSNHKNQLKTSVDATKS